MVEFLLSIVAGLFGGLLFVQLFTQKSLTAKGPVKKSEDPKKFLQMNLAYLAGLLGTISLILYWNKVF